MKYFISLNHSQFSKIERLIDDGDNEKIEKILEAAPQSSVNPISNDEVVNAILFNGNVLMDIS